MKTTRRFEELGVTIPAIPKIKGTEVEVDAKIKELKKNLKKEFEKLLTYLFEEEKISQEKLNEYKKEFFEKEYFIKEIEITDPERWRELQERWFNLNKKYFELQLELTETGCDDYEMKYIMESELYQFFHEDPDKKRERLETPIINEMEKVDAETHRIDAEQNSLKLYYIEDNMEDIYESFKNFYNKILSNE